MTRFITVTLAATLALAGCDTVPGRPKPDARELAPSEIIVFDALYARNCAGCHGRDGRLGAARALNDPVYLALVSPERLRQVIAIGVPGTAQPAFALDAGGSLTERHRRTGNSALRRSTSNKPRRRQRGARSAGLCRRLRPLSRQQRARRPARRKRHRSVLPRARERSAREDDSHRRAIGSGNAGLAR